MSTWSQKKKNRQNKEKLLFEELMVKTKQKQKKWYRLKLTNLRNSVDPKQYKFKLNIV